MSEDEQHDGDRAAAAFTKLAGEIALMRRTVERIATEKADTQMPDYSETLGEMAGQLDRGTEILEAIAENPAMQMTPADIARSINVAAVQARRQDAELLQNARSGLHRAMDDVRSIVWSANSAREQRRQLGWALVVGTAAGCLLWSVFTGIIVRSLPAHWHVPERVGARVMRAPGLWEAGIRMMEAGSPEAMRAITAAATMRRDNRETIAACEKKAAKVKKPTRCTIEIRPAA